MLIVPSLVSTALVVVARCRPVCCKRPLPAVRIASTRHADAAIQHWRRLIVGASTDADRLARVRAAAEAIESVGGSFDEISNLAIALGHDADEVQAELALGVKAARRAQP
jgi:hypothetical protein